MADIDPEPTADERAAAEALIREELSRSPGPAPATATGEEGEEEDEAAASSSQLSAAARGELRRVGAKEALAAIDLSRYEAQEGSAGSGSGSAASSALARAYTTLTYLTQRRTHLSLLERFGRNAWLVSNWQAEAELRALERDLAGVRREMDLVNIGRRRLQEDVAGELRGLDAAWREGVGRVLDAQLAAGQLRIEVLQRRSRAAAV